MTLSADGPEMKRFRDQNIRNLKIQDDAFYRHFRPALRTPRLSLLNSQIDANNIIYTASPEHPASFSDKHSLI
jgi:hypothetical protein